MSMEHKAFVFDYSAFTAEIGQILYQALSSNEVSLLIDSIEKNLSALSIPYSGEPLDSNWRNLIETGDAHEYGDFLITKFYSPQVDIGLGEIWNEVHLALEECFPEQTEILLGSAFGPESNYFDPGKMGSYFQSLVQVQNSHSLIEEFVNLYPEKSHLVASVQRMFQCAIKEQKGLYITF